MNLAAYLKYYAHKLESQDRNSLFAIRNSANSEFSFLLGDCILRYKLTDMRECGLRDMIENLVIKKDALEITTPDIPYPLIAKVVTDSYKFITVRVDSELRKYVNTSLGIDTCIYPPPIWLCVHLSKANALVGACVAVAPTPKSRWNQTVLYRWPLANVFVHSAVCLGTTRTPTLGNNTEPTDGELVYAAICQFFNSQFNSDLLLADNIYKEMLGTAFDEATHKAEWSAKLENWRSSDTYTDTLKLICVLQDPNGWRKLKWIEKVTVTAEQFVGITK